MLGITSQRGLRIGIAVIVSAVAFVAAPAANADDVADANIDLAMLQLGESDLADNTAYELAKVTGSTCEAAHICAWPDSSYNGRRGKWKGSNKDFRKFSTQSCDNDSSAGGTLNWHNCASSVSNQGTQCDNRWYDGINWTGAYYYHQRSRALSSLGDWNDRFSSNRWVGCNSK